MSNYTVSFPPPALLAHLYVLVDGEWVVDITTCPSSPEVVYISSGDELETINESLLVYPDLPYSPPTPVWADMWEDIDDDRSGDYKP